MRTIFLLDIDCFFAFVKTVLHPCCWRSGRTGKGSG
jgi:hypothetical protein